MFNSKITQRDASLVAFICERGNGIKYPTIQDVLGIGRIVDAMSAVIGEYPDGKADEQVNGEVAKAWKFDYSAGHLIDVALESADHALVLKAWDAFPKANFIRSAELREQMQRIERALRPEKKG